MLKDFDKWNEIKKNIHLTGIGKFYRESEIWWCSLGMNVGFEERGTGNGWQRPVVIVRGFSRQVCLVVPLTTSKKGNIYHFPVGYVDGIEAFALISQLRLIDTRRLTDKITDLNKEIFEELKNSIRKLF